LNSKEMAESYLMEGEIRLKTARSALEDGHFAYAVRQSQESVEMALKGALRYVGIEPPKWHDVGIILRKEVQKFPEWFTENLDRLTLISRELRREREPSMYGDSDLNLPPQELYTEFDAQEAIKKADFVMGLCKRLIS
jgi:HEPN domain-containing protein